MIEFMLEPCYFCGDPTINGLVVYEDETFIDRERVCKKCARKLINLMDRAKGKEETFEGEE